MHSMTVGRPWFQELQRAAESHIWHNPPDPRKQDPIQGPWSLVSLGSLAVSLLQTGLQVLRNLIVKSKFHLYGLKPTPMLQDWFIRSQLWQKSRAWFLRSELSNSGNWEHLGLGTFLPVRVGSVESSAIAFALKALFFYWTLLRQFWSLSQGPSYYL